jgi:N-acetylmuramoyl-L-alanine amidase
MVIGIAILLATLFTAWTPAGLLPDSLAQRFSQAVAPLAETQPASWSTSTPYPRLRIGIVSGHWGNDSGAVCPDGLQEADINQEIATQVKDSLVAFGYDVDLLKEFDPRLENYQALVLVSIHADSCEYVNDEATGFKVSAAMSTTYPENAARLTACLRQRYAASTGMSFHAGSVTADMTSYHAFDEIDSQTTAAIIEVGFLNLDRPILTENPELSAEGITNGILCFVRNEDVLSPITPTP